MTSNWTEKPIKSLGKVVTGKTPAKSEDQYYEGGTFPFVSPKDLDKDQYFVAGTETKITQKAMEKHRNQVIPQNSVLFTSLSFAFGKMAIASEPCMTNQQINSIVVNDEHDYKFVYYLLQAYRPIIFSYNSGIDTPLVPKSVFETIKVKCPDLPIQRKVAAVLSAYDDLIENNKRRIAVLENMAEEIYREWFVRFRFPGYQTAEFEKGIPTGWEVEKLGNICELAYGKALKKEDREDGQIPVYGSSGVVGYHNKALTKQGGIIVGRKGNVGSVHWSASPFFPIDTVYYVKSDISNYFLYYLMGNMNFINNDAAVPGLNRNQAYSNTLLLPGDKLIKQFEIRVKPLFEQRQIILEEISNLNSTKLALLPRLISGKLSLDELDIKSPPSMQEEHKVDLGK
ncbi:restriction endonuclease subunit S [Shewanella sedimentimangrovi]|uniref:Restriction endonuclease subunit S n=1 Tax=Shewanella sedimentimangrovi TaxID=2814293 RepID=A0ABX7QZ15_9GAMM|nr:restriction endonuclease subunit S [Shewanella sedimentimangrovi]QSX36176.1 restriction endonuclease subunit S [Shewanella sedimentimangrovi]